MMKNSLTLWADAADILQQRGSNRFVKLYLGEKAIMMIPAHIEQEVNVADVISFGGGIVETILIWACY